MTPKPVSLLELLDLIGRADAFGQARLAEELAHAVRMAGWPTFDEAASRADRPRVVERLDVAEAAGRTS